MPTAEAALFHDWKRFCFVLREIARDENGGPLPGFEAQKRAQAVLTECGYAWLEHTGSAHLAVSPCPCLPPFGSMPEETGGPKPKPKSL
jgi:hypothetical protein